MTLAAPRIVIAGTGSGVGKTSLALGLARALTRRALRVQAFKVGPDFLDPTYLTMATGRPCYNLDGWMQGEDYARGLFARSMESSRADVAIVEGVMGLFDGASPASSEGSTAEIARWLDAPVLLVVNAHGVARTLAATVKGHAELEPGINVAGVIANQTGSERHAEWLAKALRSTGLPPLVGAIGRGAFPELPSRHLGLVTAASGGLTLEILDRLADAMEAACDVEAILTLARSAPPLAETQPRAGEIDDSFNSNDNSNNDLPRRAVRVGLPFDEAFHFYYPDNLEALEAAGCELARFSPIRDAALPENLDGLYVGGGYPEEHAEALAANAPMRAAIAAFAASGRPVLAECGGLMYLSRGIETLDGARHAMAGVLPAWTRMLSKRKALGYVEATTIEPTPLGEPGLTLRGHEFHYSELCEEKSDAAPAPATAVNTAHSPAGDAGLWRAAFNIQGRRDGGARPAGFARGGVVASYVHVHFASRPGVAGHFAEACRKANP